MKDLDINCDVGEGVNNEILLMPFIQSCNIACGGHAGDERMMKKVVELAIENKVKIGAHPSYPDKSNFGRKSMLMDSGEFIGSIQNQIKKLYNIVLEAKAELHHIKPHGALYNDIAKDQQLAELFLTAIFPFKNRIKLFVPYNSEIEKLALKQGFQIIYEAFADRNYNDDLSLVSRDKKGAVITDFNDVLKHVFEMLNNEKVTTISGEKVRIKAATFCVHSDTENVVEIVKKIHQKMTI